MGLEARLTYVFEPLKESAWPILPGTADAWVILLRVPVLELPLLSRVVPGVTGL